MKAIFKRELRSLYSTPQGYVFSGAFVLVMNIFYYFVNIVGLDSDLGATFTFMLTVMIFTVPVLTMRGFSEEYRRGTDRLLFTAPIKLSSIVMGKFWGMLAAFGATLLVMTLLYAEIIILFGALNLQEYVGYMIAILTFAAVYISIGLLISALTSSQMVSMIATLGAFAVLLLLDIASSSLPDSTATRFLSSFSIFKRYDAFSHGIFSIADLVFVASCCVFFLFITTMVLHRRRHGMKGQRLRLAALAAPALAVLILANLLIGALGSRFYLKYDMTRDKIFALSEQTTDILADLPEQVTITVLSNPEEMTHPIQDTETGILYQLSDVSECLEKYAALSNDNLKLQYIDPDINPGWVRERDLTEQAGYFSIVVESNRRTRLISIRDLFETQTWYDEEGNPVDEFVVGLGAEQVITSTILNVLTEVLPKAVILTGHNEYPAEYLSALLTNCNYSVETVNITSQEIPADTELLVLAAPIYDFDERELNELDKYLSGGGNAIIAFDIAMPELPALELYLAEWGVRFEHAVVCDADVNYGNEYSLLPVIELNTFTETLNSNGRFLLAVGARPLTMLWGTDGNRVVTPIFSTYDTAYSKAFSSDEVITNLEKAEGDQNGPFKLGAISEQVRADGTGNMIAFLPLTVIADDALAMPNFLNYSLLINLLSQAQSDLTLDIPPRDMTPVPLAINSQEAAVLSIIILFAIPLLPLIAGVGVWLVRRKL